MRNIIITGGEMQNKGAQAMTFIAVDELKKRFPDHKIYVLSELDRQRPKEELANYSFEFMGWYPVQFAKCRSNPLLRAGYLLRHPSELKEAESIYRNTDLMLDISGYALGSNWSIGTCKAYLEHLIFAHAFHIPVYLMPQSFGPFDFEGEEGKKIDHLIRELLPTAKVICAREREGYDALTQKYGLNNVILADDLVLNNKGIDLKNVFKQEPEIRLPQINEGSVCIIPNTSGMIRVNIETVYELYEVIIESLVQCGKTVYLFKHSEMDDEICTNIFSRFINNKKVVYLNDEFSCFEFNQLVQKFDFIITSRFHSIIHAYKNGVACIVLGWATKYTELVKRFHQEKYMFDLRQIIEPNAILRAIDLLSEGHDKESAMITKMLEGVQQENVFDILNV